MCRCVIGLGLVLLLLARAGSAADDPREVGTLLRALRSGRAEVHGPAVAALAQRGPEVVPDVTAALPEGSVTFRRNAVAVLGAVPGAASARALADRALDDSNAGVRQAAARALGTGHPGAAATLLAGPATDPAQRGARRRRAAEAIRESRDPTAVEALLARLEAQVTAAKELRVGLGVSATESRFAGYDRSFDTDQKVRLGEGTSVTVRRQHAMPLVNTTSVQTTVAVTAVTALETLSGQRLGDRVEAWRAWWAENRERFARPPGQVPAP